MSAQWYILAVCLAVVNAASLPDSSTVAKVDFAKNVKIAFDETGDAGFLPVTSNSKSRNAGQAPAVPMQPTPAVRLRRDVDLDDVGSGEEPELVDLVHTTQQPAADMTTESPQQPTSGITTAAAEAPEAAATTEEAVVAKVTEQMLGRMVPVDKHAPAANETVVLPGDSNYNMTEDLSIQNVTVAPVRDAFKKNSVRYAIILGTLVVFWILLAPIVCLFCRHRDQQREKAEKQRASLANNPLIPEMISSELKGAPNKPQNGHATHPASEDSALLNGTKPNISRPSTPIINGTPATMANGNVATLTPASFQQLPDDIAFIDDEKVWLSQEQLGPPYDIEHLRNSQV